MPADFDKCVSGGGRVRTVKPNASTYIHVCYDKSGSHSGEVKHTSGVWDAEKDPPGTGEDANDFYRHLEGAGEEHNEVE